jgi:dTDP-D-glucose 4,6-dehydratase
MDINESNERKRKKAAQYQKENEFFIERKLHDDRVAILLSILSRRIIWWPEEYNGIRRQCREETGAVQQNISAWL